MSFDPNFCRNESEVESKLIVQYLLPQLGYSPNDWHQEAAFGRIRLDFLVFAEKINPLAISGNSPLLLIIEAKSPKHNLNNFVQKFKRYLVSLNVYYGLLTNGKEIRIYQRENSEIKLIFHCHGKNLDRDFPKIQALIGKNVLKKQIEPESEAKIPEKIDTWGFVKNIFNKKENPLYLKNKEENISNTKPQKSMKTIAIYHNKGGVGKTTTVVNLASAIRKKGKKVLVIDLDSQANTTFATGLIKFDDETGDTIKDSNIYHVLKSEELHPISEVVRTSEYSNPEIDVIPAHINLMQNEKELNELEYSKFVLLEKLAAVKEIYDVVLIDTPPSLNLYARIALIAADYLIIPSDLKPFANQGLVNVKAFIKNIDSLRKKIGKSPVELLGVLPSKISTNSKFIQATLKKRLDLIPQRYDLRVLETVIYDREDLAKSAEQVQIVGDIEIADPLSVLDYKPDSKSAQEFEILAMEILEKIELL
jgi:cellulose biosynthesis protein BcsQ